MAVRVVAVGLSRTVTTRARIGGDRNPVSLQGLQPSFTADAGTELPREGDIPPGAWPILGIASGGLSCVNRVNLIAADDAKPLPLEIES